MDRRSFFRKLMLRGLNKAEQAGQAAARRYQSIEQRLLDPAPPEVPSEVSGEASQGREAAVADGDGWQGVTHLPAMVRFLRPPGAGDPQHFLETCTACGQCVEACPAHAIVLDPRQADGKPFILPAAQPCVMCSDVACTHACPSGALTPIPQPTDIRIGLAKVDHGRCLRTPAKTVSRGSFHQGEDCTLCVDHCPAGAAALMVDETTDELRVGDACTGCGVCENVCPTAPASIIVLPWREGSVSPDESPA